MEKTTGNLDDFQALDPFFRIIEEGVAGLEIAIRCLQNTSVPSAARRERPRRLTG